ncbi:FUSC family protein [Saccharopolyspora tripterygii]
MRSNLERHGTGARLGAAARRFGGADRWLLILKSTVAATLAWVLAAEVLSASSATFAPFTSLLMMHVSVSRSIDHALRYAAAMLGGIVVAGVLSPFLGPGWWTFGLLVVLSLMLGLWRGLGSHGPQVAVAAMFAYATLVQPTDGESGWSAVASIGAMVLLGCGLAVVVNFALVPPLRYRSAQRKVGAVSREAGDLLDDIANRLREHGTLGGKSDSWLELAERVSSRAGEARDGLEDAAETGRWNPRRLLVGRSSWLQGYSTSVRGLQRITDQSRLVVTDLSHFGDEPLGGRLAEGSAAALANAAVVARTLGDLHSGEDLDIIEDLDEQVRNAVRHCEDVSGEIKSWLSENPREWLSSEALHTDLRRLVEECGQVRDELDVLRRSSDGAPPQG